MFGNPLYEVKYDDDPVVVQTRDVGNKRVIVNLYDNDSPQGNGVESLVVEGKSEGETFIRVVFYVRKETKEIEGSKKQVKLINVKDPVIIK